MKKTSLHRNSPFCILTILHSDVLIYILLFLFISSALMNSFIINKHLSADGVNYFILILDRGDFTYISWSRQFANYLTQWPLVLAIKLGLKNVPLLSMFFSIGLYFSYIVPFAICIYAVRREKSSLLIFPLVSIIGINLSSDYILNGEHHVMTLLSWPILLMSIRVTSLTLIDGSILWILLILFSSTYEAAIILAIIFSAIFVIKLCQDNRGKREKIIYSIALLLSILTFIIALYFIVNPRDPSNKDNFIIGVRAFLSNEGALAAASFVFLLTIGLIYRKVSCVLASLFPIILYACIIFFSIKGPTSYESFSNRTLSLTFLPFLLICAVGSCYYNIQVNKISMRMLVCFVLVMVVGNLRFSNDWDRFRKQIRDIVVTRKGYIPIEDTIVKDNPYRWAWNNPELGIVFSYPCVRAILLNSSDTKWEPFNPHKELILKNYINYDAFFKHIDKDVTPCK